MTEKMIEIHHREAGLRAFYIDVIGMLVLLVEDKGRLYYGVADYRLGPHVTHTNIRKESNQLVYIETGNKCPRGYLHGYSCTYVHLFELDRENLADMYEHLTAECKTAKPRFSPDPSIELVASRGGCIVWCSGPSGKYIGINLRYPRRGNCIYHKRSVTEIHVGGYTFVEYNDGVRITCMPTKKELQESLNEIYTAICALADIIGPCMAVLK
jgi:hypothetical protein